MVVVADSHIQAFVFIAENGQHVSMSRKECEADTECVAMAAAMIDAKNYESINVGDCNKQDGQSL